MKSNPAPLKSPKLPTTPYRFPASPPNAVFSSVGKSWEATSIVNVLPPMTNSSGCIDAMVEDGISTSPVFESNIAPRMADKYVENKSSARRTTDGCGIGAHVKLSE